MTNATFFADNQLLFKNIEINSIQFQKNKMELIDDQWQLQVPMDISPDHLKQIVFAWKNTSALKVTKYDPPEKETFITISTTKNETIKFVVISIEPYLVLGRKDIGIQYSIGNDEAKKLLLYKDSETTEESEPMGLELR
jgi:hypothetical protein